MIATPEYVEYWHHFLQQQQQCYQQLAQQARADLAAMVQLLVQQFGATKIILFGSLVKGTFAAGSDIDLAVAGIPPHQFFAALGAVNQISRVWVDLKPLENLDSYFFNKVVHTGECLYEETTTNQCSAGTGHGY